MVQVCSVAKLWLVSKNQTILSNFQMASEYRPVIQMVSENQYSDTLSIWKPETEIPVFRRFWILSIQFLYPTAHKYFLINTEQQKIWNKWNG